MGRRAHHVDLVLQRRLLDRRLGYICQGRSAASVVGLLNSIIELGSFVEGGAEVSDLGRRAHHELVLQRNLLHSRLSNEGPLCLIAGQTKGAVGVLVDVALLEHQVDLLLHITVLVDLLLHLLKTLQLFGDVGLFLLLLELLLMDLGL